MFRYCSPCGYCGTQIEFRDGMPEAHVAGCGRICFNGPANVVAAVALKVRGRSGAWDAVHTRGCRACTQP